jgi:hypothetical protein
MPHTNTSGRRGLAAGALLILLLACVGLAACGGSSSTTSSDTNAASTGTTAATTTTGTSSTRSGTTTRPGAGRVGTRFAALRECLQKNGITLPQRKPGGGRPAGGAGFIGGGTGPTLPKGVTRAQYEAALKKCGGSARFGGGGGARFANNPQFKAAVAKYAECLRQNGVNVPAPNTSGKGPVFDTKGIDTTSPQFKTATTKCRGTLAGAFRRLPGRGGPNGTGGPPGGGGSAGGGAPAGQESSG